MTTRSVDLMGYHLEPGTAIAGCIYLTHRNPSIYPEPEQFKPERFLERKYSPYEYLPFGSGVRQCIGMALAQYEMKLTLATVMLNYELALVDSKPPKASRRGVTLAAQGGIPMVLKGRRSQPEKSVEVATVS